MAREKQAGADKLELLKLTGENGWAGAARQERADKKKAGFQLKTGLSV
ncbi:hypothetical protein [Alcaligenes faecalis]|nr:hypothetical protein [Alcaligenes faecalis]